MNIDERFNRCIVAAAPAMGREAATLVCQQAVFASRGLANRRMTAKRTTSRQQRLRASGTPAKSEARGSPRGSSGAARRTRSARGRYSTGTGQ
jgi:hypothetical protein